MKKHTLEILVSVLLLIVLIAGVYFYVSNNFLSKPIWISLTSSTTVPMTKTSEQIALSVLKAQGVYVDHPTLAGNTLYLLQNGQSGGFINIYNISNPSKPVFLDKYTPGFYQITGLYILGKYTYLALAQAVSELNDPPGGLQIVNISNPTKPVKVSMVNQTPLRGVSGFGNYLVTATNVGIKTYDISNQDSPQLITNYSENGYIRSVEDFDMISSSTVRMTVILSNVNPDNDIYVQLIDISNPAKPVLASSTPYSEYGYYEN